MIYYAALSLVQKHQRRTFDCQYKLGVAAWLGTAPGCGGRGVFFVYAYVISPAASAQKRVVAATMCLPPLLIFRFCCDEHTSWSWYMINATHHPTSGAPDRLTSTGTRLLRDYGRAYTFVGAPTMGSL